MDYSIKRYLFRLLVAVVAFVLGLAAIVVLRRNESKDSESSRAIHSTETNTPYAVLENGTVRIQPSNATFEIPDSWLQPAAEKNLYLSATELNYVYLNSKRDAEDAQVINAVLPFEFCAAHVGNKDWGNDFWNDLQARVYVVDWSYEEIDKRVRTGGLSTAKSVFEAAEVSAGTFGEWQLLTLEVVDAPTHFILGKDINFYHRKFGRKTVVFVFIHAGDYEDAIKGILSSFKWPDARLSGALRAGR